MDNVIVYHAKCMDGFGAAWVAYRKFGLSRTLFVPATYGDPPPAVKGLNVYILDFSYPLAELQAMSNDARSVLVLDHHKSAAEALGELPDAPVDYLHWITGWPKTRQLAKQFDMQRSGAMLAWSFFFPGQDPPRLIQHIQDRDLWRFELDGSREVHAWLSSVFMDFGEWDQLAYELENPETFAQALRVGERIMAVDKQRINEMISEKNVRFKLVAGYLVPVLNCPWFLASEAGHYLCPAFPFSATYYDAGDVRRWSLRSDADGIDVSNIAKKFGGGGHKHAAGFETEAGFMFSDNKVEELVV